MEEPKASKRRRKAAGPDRPSYFDASDIDRVVAIVLALASEVASIRNRLDTHERLGTGGLTPSVAAVEGYRSEPEVERERDLWRDAYIKRIFRVVTEDIEALRQGAGKTRSDQA